MWMITIRRVRVVADDHNQKGSVVYTTMHTGTPPWKYIEAHRKMDVENETPHFIYAIVFAIQIPDGEVV